MNHKLAVLLKEWTERFLEHLEVRNYSVRTLHTYRRDLALFRDWAVEETEAESLAELDRELLHGYQRFLLTRPTRDGRRGRVLSVGSRNRHVAVLRSFFRYLMRSEVLLGNPADRLETARQERRLPVVLSEQEVARILGAIELSTPVGLRDRVIVEILYATGMRQAELLGLQLHDLDLAEELVRILGKGNRERVVPLGREAARAVRQYLAQARPRLARPGVEHLLVSYAGKPLMGKDLGNRLKTYARVARVRKRVTCHIFRHSCATHLLKRGADVRYIQALLGHAKLSTTQLYTRVEVADLREVLRRCHPREQALE